MTTTLALVLSMGGISAAYGLALWMLGVRLGAWRKD
jgi:hypothetical protein